ncbi:MAG TPA: substrate-binding domain-containing protein [Candidatus Binatia bacterium]|jgi:phosphate transport system substrate-binding protein
MSMARFASAIVAFFFLLPPGSFAQAPQQKITVGGAQSLVPLAEKFSAKFRKDHPGIEIDIRRANSNYGVHAVQSGEIEIGLVTRNLTGAEQTQLRVESMGHDAIIFLSYPWNKVTNLSLEQLRRIYLGKIANWREVGGEDKGIVPLTREGSSALHGMFAERLFGKGFNTPEKAFVLRANKDKILRTIKRVRGSLGYGIVAVEEAQAEGVKVLAIEGKSPTDANIQQGIYPFTRPLLLVSKNNAKPLAEDWMREFVKFAHEAESNR